MSEPSTSEPVKAGPAKEPVSPVRNIIGLVVLVAVVAFGWFEYSAKARYNSVVNALNDRMAKEDLGLMTQAEAEQAIGKAPDDAGGDAQVGGFDYTRKTYTWKGLIKTYTLAAYYTKDREPSLHHIEAGETFDPEANNRPALAEAAPGPPSSSGPPPSGAMRKFGDGRGKAGRKGAPRGEPKADEQKGGEKPNGDAGEKAKAPEPKADDKPKSDADRKGEVPAKAD